jgi:NAD(P)-dependent dehydrogenase (short-subunit alcohol dehydrogenase family)
MAQRVWLVTGVSRGLGRHVTERLLARGQLVVGTVGKPDTVADLSERYPSLLRVDVLDARDSAAPRAVVERTVTTFGRIDVVVGATDYGVFGTAEELTAEKGDAVLGTNPTASIQLIRAALPHMRAAGGGRIIQLSSCDSQNVFPRSSFHHATRSGVEAFCESVAQEVAPFGIGVTIAETRGQGTSCYDGVQLPPAQLVHRRTQAVSFAKMLGPVNSLAVDDPVRMAAAIVDSADLSPAPPRLILGCATP